MITRSAFAIGIVWLCMPHHPDLGLPDEMTSACRAVETCALTQPADLEREAIFKRLREVKNEINDARKYRAASSSSDVDGQEATSQKVNYLAAAAFLLNQVAQNSGPNERRQ
jgi:hypothetical protein